LITYKKEIESLQTILRQEVELWEFIEREHLSEVQKSRDFVNSHYDRIARMVEAKRSGSLALVERQHKIYERSFESCKDDLEKVNKLQQSIKEHSENIQDKEIEWLKNRKAYRFRPEVAPERKIKFEPKCNLDEDSHFKALDKLLGGNVFENITYAPNCQLMDVPYKCKNLSFAGFLIDTRSFEYEQTKEEESAFVVKFYHHDPLNDSYDVSKQMDIEVNMSKITLNNCHYIRAKFMVPIIDTPMCTYWMRVLWRGLHDVNNSPFRLKSLPLEVSLTHFKHQTLDKVNSTYARLNVPAEPTLLTCLLGEFLFSCTIGGMNGSKSYIETYEWNWKENKFALKSSYDSCLSSDEDNICYNIPTAKLFKDLKKFEIVLVIVENRKEPKLVLFTFKWPFSRHQKEVIPLSHEKLQWSFFWYMGFLYAFDKTCSTFYKMDDKKTWQAIDFTKSKVNSFQWIDTFSSVFTDITLYEKNSRKIFQLNTRNQKIIQTFDVVDLESVRNMILINNRIFGILESKDNVSIIIYDLTKKSLEHQTKWDAIHGKAKVDRKDESIHIFELCSKLMAVKTSGTKTHLTFYE
jgi:hypothetical protein